MQDPLAQNIKDFAYSKSFKDKVERTYKYSLKKGEKGDFELMHAMMIVSYQQIYEQAKCEFVDFINTEVAKIEQLKNNDPIDTALDTMLLIKKIQKFAER